MEKIPEDAGASASGAQPGPEALPDSPADNKIGGIDGSDERATYDSLESKRHTGQYDLPNDPSRIGPESVPLDQEIDNPSQPEKAEEPQSILDRSRPLFGYRDTDPKQADVNTQDEPITIESHGTGTDSLRRRLDEQARKEIDPYSTAEARPDPDSGAGASTLAHAFVERVTAMTGSGELPPKITVCEVETDTGLGARYFMDTLQSLSPRIYERTTMTVTSRSEQRVQAMRDSMFKDHANVTIEYVAPDDTTGHIPAGTLAILYDQALNRLPAHPVYWDGKVVKDELSDKPVVREVMEDTTLTDQNPIVTIDKNTGRTHIVPAANLSDTYFVGASRGQQEMLEISPRLRGRIISDPHFVDEPRKILVSTVLELQELRKQNLIDDGQFDAELTKATNQYKAATPHRSLGPELARQEDDVEAFMDHMPVDHPTNFTPGATDKIESALQNAHPEALIMITGPLRLQPDHKLPVRGLRVQEGALSISVLDALHVRQAVENTAKGGASPDEQILELQTNPGGYGYLLIDKTRHPERRITSEAILESMDSRRIDLERLLARGAAKLGIARSIGPDEVEKAVAYVEAKYTEVVKRIPGPIAYSTELGLAEMYNGQVTTNNGTPELNIAALKHAHRAASILPYASAPQVQIALASLRLGNPLAAKEALARARLTSPSNPNTYRVGIYAALQNTDPRQRTEEYIKNLTHFLHYAPELSTKTTVDLLQKLCAAKESRWKMCEATNRPFKTILHWNTETGELDVQVIDEATIRKIEAADMYASALEATQTLLGTSPYETGTNQEREGLLDTLVKGLVRTSFYDDSGELIPRDSWPDRAPANSPTYLVYDGDITQSDEETPPVELMAFLQKIKTQNIETITAVDQQPEQDESPLDELEIGEIISPTGEGTGQFYPLHIEAIDRHVLILGATGSGKTVLIKRILSGLPDMNVNFVHILCGEKEGEYDDMVARLEGKAQVRIIRIGDISLNLYEPEENTPEAVKKTIKNILDVWEKAYDEMRHPMTGVFEEALRRAYAATGWELGHPDYPPAVGMEPSVPTFKQLSEAMEERTKELYADETGGSDTSRTVAGFLVNRNESLEKDGAGSVLQGDSPLDKDEAYNGHVIFDLGGVTDPYNQRLIAHALYADVARYYKKNRSPNGERVNTVISIDEAHVMVGTPKESNNTSSAAAQQEAIERDIRQLRALGICLMVGTQESSINPAIISQTATKIVMSLADALNREKIGKEIRGSRSLEEISGTLATLRQREALAWYRGASTPLRIRTTNTPGIPKGAVEAALKRQLPLPILKTSIDRKAVEEAAESAEAALAQTFIHSVCLSHTTGSELPYKVPYQLKAWWKDAHTKNPQFADRVLRRMVGNIVGERARAVNESQHPSIIGKSVYSITRAMLEGMPTGPGRHVSASFIVPQVAWVKTMNSIDALDPDTVSPDRLTPYPQHKIPDFHPTPGQKVAEVAEQLRRIPLSPYWDPTTLEIVGHAIEGGENAPPSLWGTIRTVTGMPPSLSPREIFERRRQVAAELGQTTLHNPKVGSNIFEGVPDLATKAKWLAERIKNDLTE